MLSGGRGPELDRKPHAATTFHFTFSIAFWAPISLRSMMERRVISLIPSELQTQYLNEEIYSYDFPSQDQNESGIWACTNKLSYLPGHESRDWCYSRKINIFPNSGKPGLLQPTSPFLRQSPYFSYFLFFSLEVNTQTDS